MMEKRKVTFVICTIAIALLGIASVQIGVRQIAAQEAIASGSHDDTCPWCSVNFSADVTAANITSQASADTPASNTTAIEAPVTTAPVTTAPVTRAAVTHNVTVLFYWQPGCPHCDNMRPSVERLEGSSPSVHLVFVNTLEDPQSALAHGVTGTPTTIVLNEGKEVSRYNGEFDTTALQQQLEQLTT
jgi:thioredoxin-like negative regulator of GroEL